MQDEAAAPHPERRAPRGAAAASEGGVRRGHADLARSYAETKQGCGGVPTPPCSGDEVTRHELEAGRGPPVVLLHGIPRTPPAGRHVTSPLAARGRVIAPDLRGLGDPVRPRGGRDEATVAEDVWRLIHDHLGVGRFCVAGHDRDGPGGFAPAAAHRGAVLDVAVPGGGVSQGGGRRHRAFSATPDLFFGEEHRP